MEHGYSYADAGRSLGVHGNMISRWKRELEVQGKHAYPGNGRLTPEQQRIHELEKENRRLQMERDILKKATASSLPRKAHEVWHLLQRNASEGTGL